MIRFSERTNWESSENRLSLALEEVRCSGRPWINLTESNPTRCGLAYPEDILQALSDPGTLRYDPDAKGLKDTRQAVCEYYRRRGHSVSSDQVILTSGTSEAYSYLFRLLANPGDAVLFPRPSYPLFQFLADLNDARLTFYDLAYENHVWRIDRSSLDNIDAGVKAVVTVNPNNPTGSYIKEDETAFLNEMCQRSNLALISDEVFHDYAFDTKCRTSLVGNDQCLTFTMNGLSKILGLPQMKLSWIVVSGPKDDVEQAIKRLEVIADTYLSVNTPVQRAWPVWLKHLDSVQGGICDRIADNYLWLVRTLEGKKDVRCLKAEGGWYAMVEISDILGEEEWVLKFLKEASVYVHPGYFFDADQGCCIVLSLLPAPEAFRSGVEKILHFIKNELSKL